jgi:cell division protein YceG involved in septum cleavage
MYLIILGTQQTINKIMTKLNKESDKNITKNDSKNDGKNDNKKTNKTYVMAFIDKPCAEIIEMDEIQNIILNDAKKTISDIKKGKQNIDKEIDLHKKYIILDEGIETAQCLTYAEGYKNYYMLLEIIHEPTHFRLTFPILQLDEEVNPDELISTWIVKNNISNIAKDLTVKPVNIVGIEHDILVFAACINNDNSD